MVPMTPFDQERLLSYRNGAEVSVVITQEVASWRRRKYWAILNKVVETCQVKARTAQDLHDAIRREIGFVDAYHSNGTNLRITLKSTSKLDEQAFTAFFNEAMETLSEWTGLDAETLGKESADVGPDRTQESSSEAPLPHEDDQAAGVPHTQAPAPAAENLEMQPPAGEKIRSTQDGSMETASATGQSPVDAASTEMTNSSQESGAEVDGNAGDEPAKPSTSDLRAKMEECLTKLLGVATDPSVPDAKARQDNLVFAKNVWKLELKERSDFVKACTDICNKVIKEKMTAGEARAELERWLP